MGNIPQGTTFYGRKCGDNIQQINKLPLEYIHDKLTIVLIQPHITKEKQTTNTIKFTKESKNAPQHNTLPKSHHWKVKHTTRNNFL